MIIARTDAREVESLQGAIERAEAYKRAGADAIFPEALKTREEFEEFRRKVPNIPLMANLAEQGKTSASLTAQNLIDAGYSMILFPATGTRAMFDAHRRVLDQIEKHGTARRIVRQKRLMPRGEVDDFLRKNSRVYHRPVRD